VVWFFPDYDATPIKVVLHCFGLLVGLCQMDISRRLPNLNNQREFGARVCKDGLDHLPNPLKVLRKVSGNLLNLPPIKRQRAVQTLCSDQIKDLGVRTPIPLSRKFTFKHLSQLKNITELSVHY
jgi:hypothetical protein